jgi:hypothetical protein
MTGPKKPCVVFCATEGLAVALLYVAIPDILSRPEKTTPPNGLLFSCAKTIEEFAATLNGPAVSMIVKSSIQLSSLSSTFQPLRSRPRCPLAAAVDDGWCVRGGRRDQ